MSCYTNIRPKAANGSMILACHTKNISDKFPNISSPLPIDRRFVDDMSYFGINSYITV